MAQITGASIEIADPAELAEAFARAWEIFESARPRPVHIAIPIDVLDLECPTPVRLPRRGVKPIADPVAIDQAAALLARAQTPMLLVGGGAIDAGAEVTALAELIGAPIGMTVNAKGLVGDDHPLSLGTTLTLGAVFDALSMADVVVAVGTELSETDFFYAPELRPPTFAGQLIRIDIDAGQLTRQRPAAVGLHGDAAPTVAALRTAVAARRSAVDGSERAEALRSASTWWTGAEKFMPFLDALAASIPTDGILLADSTQPAYVAHHYWPGRRARGYIAPGGFGTLGPALPMAVGAQLASAGTPVAVLVGDGGFLFTIQELATAADERLPIAVVLWQNHGYAEIRDSMDRIAVPHVGVDTTARDYLKLAEGFGCRGVRATSLGDLGRLLVEAFAADRATVIEVSADLS